MRVLQVLWDGGGNVPPQLAIARELVRRGHEVRVLGHRCQRARVEATGAAFSSFEHGPDADASRPETDLIRDWEARTPMGAFARTRDNLLFGPALEFARDVVAELERTPTDVIAFDFLLSGAGVGAEAAGVPAAMIVHTVYPFPVEGAPPFGQGLRPARGPFGKARDAILMRGLKLSFAPGLKPLNTARVKFGLAPLDDVFDYPGRADLCLVLTSAELDFASMGTLPDNVFYAGPVIERGPVDAHWDSPWPIDDPRPLVLASFSTTFQDQRSLAGRVLAALGQLPVRALLTTGPALDVSGLEIPANVEVREFVSHAVVLPQTSLVVTHAGLGTVHAALADGVPMVCIPDGRDQNDNAARLMVAGAGVRLPRWARARRIRGAIAAALDEGQLYDNAAGLAAAFAREDGLRRAADQLEALGECSAIPGTRRSPRSSK